MGLILPGTQMDKSRQSNEPLDIKELESEYKTLTPILASFCDEISHQIVKLIEESNVTMGFPVQYRLKTWESLSEKLDRLPRFSKLLEIQDLVGLRIILLFKRDVEIVTQLIHNNFTVVRQYNTQERLKEDQFGYSSIHLIIQLRDDWLSVPTLSKMKGMIAEIQIRTLAQHIWAEASHKLQYKQEKNIPPVIRRSIFRVSALLETVDLEFERVLEERESYRNYIVDGMPTSLDERLNVDLLETLLDSLLPSVNKSPNEDYATLLMNLEHFGIKTKQQLESLFEKHISHVIEYDVKKAHELITEHNNGSVKLLPYTLSRARKNVYFAHTGLVRQILRLEFGQNATEYFRDNF